jgi:hypothetical protein
MAKLLSAPHGSELLAHNIARDPRGILDPNSAYRRFFIDQIGANLAAGVEVFALDSFPLRGAYTDAEREAILNAQLGIAAQIGLFREGIEVVLAWCPTPFDCYLSDSQIPTQAEVKDALDFAIHFARAKDLQLLLETTPDEDTARHAAALLASADVPSVLSFTLDPARPHFLRTGTSFAQALTAAEQANPHLRLGVNCSTPNAEVLDSILSQAQGRVQVIYPNAVEADPATLECTCGSRHGLQDAQASCQALSALAQKHHLDWIGWCCGGTVEDVKRLGLTEIDKTKILAS